MTREEAIIILKCAMPNSNVGCGESDEEIEEAMTMAIEALKEKSTVDKIIADVKELDGRHLIGDYENERWIEIMIYPMI